MSPDEAIAQLDYHAGGVDDGRPVPSFVGMLRPYRGLRVDAFDDVMRCLRTLAPLLRGAETLPKALVATLWALIWYPRYWALDPEGMLRRNALINDEEQAQLQAWLDRIAHSVSQLLEGATDRDAFEKP